LATTGDGRQLSAVGTGFAPHVEDDLLLFRTLRTGHRPADGLNFLPMSDVDPQPPEAKPINPLFADVEPIDPEEQRRLNDETAKAAGLQLRKAYATMLDIWPRLLDLGWYLSPNLRWGAENELRRFFDIKDVAAVDQAMTEAARGRANDVADAVDKHFPYRRRFVERAVQAHMDKDYVVSIPLFISQADGIGEAILGVSFTSRKAGNSPKDALANLRNKRDPKKVTPEQSMLTDAFLEGLRHYTVITENTKQRDQKRIADPSYSRLNRHGVLHGLDTDYDDEKNSLQSMMMVDFIAAVPDFL
jgi:hypothetical protein